MTPSTRTISFDGELLRRGFWLYAWKIACNAEVFYYVGRTGDSSSCNAASPFNRIGNHLDPRPNAKANALTRRLIEVGLKPEECNFRMAAVGPLYPEQETFDDHKVIRDRVATLEHEVAKALRARGLKVLGVHSRSAAVDPQLVEHVIQELSSALSDA